VIYTLHNWLVTHIDLLIATSNFTTAIGMLLLMGAIIFTMIHMKLSKSTDLFWILIGVVVETFGWFLHRLFYGTRRILQLQEDYAFNSYVGEYTYITLIPIGIILLGLVLILSPLFSIFTCPKQGCPKDNTGVSCRWCNIAITSIMFFAISWFIWWHLGDMYEIPIGNLGSEVSEIESERLLKQGETLGSSWPKTMPEY